MGKFVLKVPKWQGELLFSKEILLLMGVVLLLIVGTLFCFWGYKYFRTVLLVGIGVVICYLSYLLVEPMTTNLAVRMFLTVSLTFLGVCLVYFLDIIFCYILDKLRIRNALGKRSYLLAAPLGAAVLGLTIYYFIWRDEITVGVFSGVCLVVGLIFQHSKRKKQIRFRSYNDLIRMKRPQQGEDDLENLPVGMAGAAALAPVASVLVTPEPEPESEIMPVSTLAEPEPVYESEAEAVVVPMALAEPEPICEPEVEIVSVAEMAVEPEVVSEIEPESEFEPEPVFMRNVELQALSEIESEFAVGSEYGRSLWLEAEPITKEKEEPKAETRQVIKATEEALAEAGQNIEEKEESAVEVKQIVEAIEAPTAEPEQTIGETVAPVSVAELEKIVKQIMASAAEPDIEPVSENPDETQNVSMEISDEVKELILRKMESEEELLEEAFFVRRISRKMAEEKQGNAQKKADQQERKDVRIKAGSSVYPGKITINGKGRKPRRKREEGMARGAAIAAAGLGAFIVGRISKGGD